MNIVQQGPTPNAGPGVGRGLITNLAQVIDGVKTFNNKIVVAAQAGGDALVIDTVDTISWNGYGRLGPLGTMLSCDLLGFRTQSGNGFWMGGVNSAFNSGGLSASSQGYAVDIQQGQNQSISVITNFGLAAGVANKIGTYRASPHASAELLRVGYGLQAGTGSDGTAVLKVLGGGLIIAGAPATAPTDADLMNGSISFYLDEAGNNLKVRVKYSSGTLKTATIALA